MVNAVWWISKKNQNHRALPPTPPPVLLYFPCNKWNCQKPLFPRVIMPFYTEIHTLSSLIQWKIFHLKVFSFIEPIQLGRPSNKVLFYKLSEKVLPLFWSSWGILHKKGLCRPAVTQTDFFRTLSFVELVQYTTFLLNVAFKDLLSGDLRKVWMCCFAKFWRAAFMGDLCIHAISVTLFLSISSESLYTTFIGPNMQLRFLVFEKELKSSKS